MTPLGMFVIGCATIAAGYQLFQVFAAWWFFRRARRTGAAAPDGELPPVTVLKPLKGLGVDLYDNLASFCGQDYPAYQIVFGIADVDDPALTVVQQIKRDFPRHDIVLSIGTALGANRKVANLRHMMRHARHGILVLSDADVRVRPDYLKAMVRPLADRATGLTTCLYRGVGRFGLPSVLESLFINSDFIPMVITAQLVEPFRYAFGASIALRREAYERIGGFAPLADYLADDYQLGARVAAAGYRLVLLPYVVETVLDSVTLGDVWRHLVRWSRTYRVSRPLSWFFTLVTHATFWGSLAPIATGGTSLGWSVFAAALGARLLSLVAILRLLDDRETLHHLWLVPLKDIFNSFMWGAAFLGRRVTWSGQELRVEADGRMTPLAPAEALAQTPAAKAAGG